jgi:hypothetical protein
MAGEIAAIMAMLEKMRQEHREDHGAVLDRINRLDEKMANLNADGCAQAWQHKAQSVEIRALKEDVVSLRESRAEGKGRGAVVAVMVSAVVSVVIAAVVAMIKGG